MRAATSLLLVLALAGCAAAPPQGSGAFNSAATIHAPAERQIVITVRNSPPRTAQHAGSYAKGYDTAGRYQASPAALRDVSALERRYGLRELAAWPIEVLGVHCIVFEVQGDRPLPQVLAQVQQDARVESVQPLQTFRAQSGTSSTYDDPYVGLQDGIAAMQVEEAHRWSRGRGVRVAVIDSGVDDTHPDLARRITMVRDLTGLPAGAARHDTHGTAVAGVIAADAGNALGIVGIAPEANLLVLRACWQVTGDAGSESRCNTFTLAQALVLAISERAAVINLSLTGPADPLLERLLKRAMAMGKIVVTAIPEGGLTAQESFPASLPGVLAVATAEQGSAGARDGDPLRAGTQRAHAASRRPLRLRERQLHGRGERQRHRRAAHRGEGRRDRGRDPHAARARCGASRTCREFIRARGQRVPRRGAIVGQRRVRAAQKNACSSAMTSLRFCTSLCGIPSYSRAPTRSCTYGNGVYSQKRL